MFYFDAATSFSDDSRDGMSEFVCLFKMFAGTLSPSQYTQYTHHSTLGCTLLFLGLHLISCFGCNFVALNQWIFFPL